MTPDYTVIPAGDGLTGWDIYSGDECVAFVLDAHSNELDRFPEYVRDRVQELSECAVSRAEGEE